MNYPALCDGAHHHAFHPNRKHRAAFANTYCANCPDRQECANDAYRANRDGYDITDPASGKTKNIRHPIQDGIWGGIDFTRDTSAGRDPIHSWLKRIGQHKWNKENPT